MDKKKLIDKVKPLLKAILPAAGKKAGSEAIKVTTGVGIPAQQTILDIFQLGLDADKKITRREFLARLGNKLKARQPGKIAKGYADQMKKFSYMADLIKFYIDYH